MLTAAVAAHQMTRRDPAAAARAREALDDGVLVRAVNGEGALVAGWLTLIAAGDPLALSSLDDAVVLAHRQGSLRALSAAYCFRALGRLWYGRLAEAEEDAREALRMTETGRVDLDVSFAGAYLADALVHQGRLDEAGRVLAGIGVPAADPFDRPRYYALESWAELLLVSGRPAEARRAAEEAGRVWRAYGFDNPAVGAWRTTAGMAAHQLGETDAAAALLRAEVGLAREWGAARPLGRALRALGTATGDVAALREAVDLVADGAGGRLERAYARFALGAHLRRAGARTEARDLFGLALDEADVCGADLLAGWVAGELRVAGFRPRRNRITGRSALTPSELRVAELAAGGATNREIAQALYVTTKTVEVHLSSAYRKLGVAGTARSGRGARLILGYGLGVPPDAANPVPRAGSSHENAVDHPHPADVRLAQHLGAARPCPHRDAAASGLPDRPAVTDDERTGTPRGAGPLWSVGQAASATASARRWAGAVASTTSSGRPNSTARSARWSRPATGPPTSSTPIVSARATTPAAIATARSRPRPTASASRNAVTISGRKTNSADRPWIAPDMEMPASRRASQAASDRLQSNRASPATDMAAAATMTRAAATRPDLLRSRWKIASAIAPSATAISWKPVTMIHGWWAPWAASPLTRSRVESYAAGWAAVAAAIAATKPAEPAMAV